MGTACDGLIINPRNVEPAMNTVWKPVTIANDTDRSTGLKDESDSQGVLVYRPVLIETDHLAGFCLMRCISNKALIGRFHAQLAEGSPTTIYFSDLISAVGSVVRSSKDWLEVSFAPEINVTRLLAVLARQNTFGKPNRALRLDMSAEIELRHEHGSMRVEMADISQRGLKVRSAPMELGSEVTIAIGNLAIQRANVRWAQNGEIGLSFCEPLSFEDLGKWCVEQRSSSISSNLGDEIFSSNSPVSKS